ncbi:MAG TPA: sugar kinase [Chloroflexota bacterium]
MARRSVVTFGEAMLRLSAPHGSRLELTQSLDVHVGGAESNVAVALARLGVPATWLGCLPESPLARRILSEIAVAGVNVSRVKQIEEGRVGLYFVEFGAPPRPTTVWYDRRDSAINCMEAGDLAVEALNDAAFAVLSGITPALSPAARALSHTFVEEARARGARVCIDVNYRARLWSPATARETMADFMAMADVVVCSEQDARILFKLEGTDENVLETLRACTSTDANLVVLTQSERGCLASTFDGLTFRQPAVSTSMVDRFGAGDAFTAGLLWGLLESDVETALRAGASLAALKCTTAGDHSLATRRELEGLMQADSETAHPSLLR